MVLPKNKKLNQNLMIINLVNTQQVPFKYKNNHFKVTIVNLSYKNKMKYFIFDNFQKTKNSNFTK